MSFAGFAGLMNALRRRGETWEPMELYQLRIIVAYAIATLFGSVLVVPFVELFGQHDGVQWLGALMLIASSALAVGNMRSDISGGHGTVLSRRVRATFTTITSSGSSHSSGLSSRVRRRSTASLSSSCSRCRLARSYMSSRASTGSDL